MVDSDMLVDSIIERLRNLPRHRVGICGPPQAGKTTLSHSLARRMNAPVIHTDDWLGTNWEDQPLAILSRMGELEDAKTEAFIVEGVQVARVVRKALREGQPCPVDLLVWLRVPRVPLTAGQARMAKGLDTIRATLFEEYPDVMAGIYLGLDAHD